MQIQLNFKENLKWNSITINALKKGLTASGILIMNNLKSNMSVGVNEQLKAGNKREVVVDKKEVYLRVYNTVKYAPYVEFGTRPHWPPVEALEEWCARHFGGKENAFILARVISKKGTKPKHFFRNAFYDNQDKIKQIIETEVNRAL